MTQTHFYMLAMMVLGFLLGVIVMAIIHSHVTESATGTIVIEEHEGDDPDLFRFDLPLQLEEIKKTNQIIFNVKVEKVKGNTDS